MAAFSLWLDLAIDVNGHFLENERGDLSFSSAVLISVSRKVGRVLTSDDVHVVSLADKFTVQFSNFLKLPLECKTKQFNGPGNYQELRETAPWPESHPGHIGGR